MSGRGGTPWWYSGDDETEPQSAGESQREPQPDATSDRPDEPGGAGLDWSLLVAGAQWVMDWAAEKVVVPHAEHDDPAEHPQCVVCRTLVLIGDTGAPADLPADEGIDAAGTEPAATAIRWIPILDDDDGPPEGARQ